MKLNIKRINNKLLFLILIVVMLFFVGCGKQGEQNSDPNSSNTSDTGKNNTEAGNTGASTEGKTGYAFEYNDVTIYMNTDAAPLVEALGGPQEYFEAESCAFKGLDKIYYYNGFELSTYPKDGKDFVASVDLKDDSVSTTEGIYLGSTVEELVKAYGDNYTEEMGLYTYSKGDTNLTFLVEDGVVSAITYLAVVEGLQ